MKKEIYLLTGNQSKVDAANLVFNEHEITLKLFKPDIDEIQANTSLEVARHTALHIAKEHNINVVREDHALYFEGVLGGSFPGPYTAYYDKSASAEEFLSLLYPNKDRKTIEGYFELGCVYAEPDGTTIELTHRVPIEVSKEIRGSVGNIEKILMIKGYGKTFAECEPGEITHYFSKNFEVLAERLEGNGGKE